MPAERSAEPSKYPFRCVTSPSRLRDSILIVGPPISTAGAGRASAPGAAALALAGSPAAEDGAADEGAVGKVGISFSIAASSCLSASHRSVLVAALVAPGCAFSAASSDAASESSAAIARRALAVSPAPSAWLSVCASPAKVATGPNSALASGFSAPSASGAFRELSHAKAWLLSSEEAALGSSAACAAGIAPHNSAPNSAASSARRQHVAMLAAGSLVRRNIDVSGLQGQYM